MEDHLLLKEDKRFYESIFILYKCKQAINNLWYKIQGENDFINGFEYSDTPLLYHIILEVVNFNDEYSTYFNSKNFDKYSCRISQVREINKPIFRSINKWNLKEFRNNIIAHPWRKNKKFAHPDSLEYEIPRNALDFTLLVNYINYAWNIMESEFRDELDKSIQYMLSISNLPERKKDYSDLNNEQLKLVREVNLKCMEFKKKYHLKVFVFNFSEI